MLGAVIENTGLKLKRLDIQEEGDLNLQIPPSCDKGPYMEVAGGLIPHEEREYFREGFWKWSGSFCRVEL